MIYKLEDTFNNELFEIETEEVISMANYFVSVMNEELECNEELKEETNDVKEAILILESCGIFCRDKGAIEK